MKHGRILARRHSRADPDQRGEFVESPLAEYVTATVHPSSILRAPSDEARRTERARFVDDLRKIREVLGELAA